jgi:transcriptional regulator with XRE-family HTH domain
MKPNSEWRRKLGLTQEEMAGYLGVSRSLVMMYENGRRYLPVPAMQKLAEIAAFISKPATRKKLPPTHVKTQQAKARQLLQKQAKELAYKQQLLQRKLEAAQKVYDQKLLLMDLLDHLKQKPAARAMKRPENMALKKMEQKALQYINSNGLHEQALLQAKILTYKQQQQQAILLKQLMFS